MLSSEITNCECFEVIHTNNPHQCNKCKRNFSACLYVNELQHKITLQAAEIDQLKHELNSFEVQLRSQRLEFETLNQKYLAGIDRVTEYRQQRELANCELEELSARLFEEANEMVANEKREKQQLLLRLRQTEDQLLTEQSQLYELRARIESTTACSSPPPPYFDDVKMAQTIRIYNDQKVNIIHSSETSTQQLFLQLKQQQDILLNKQDETHTQMVSPVDTVHVINSHTAKTTTTTKTTTTKTTTTLNKDADDLFVNHGGVLQLDHFQKFIQQQKKRYSSVPSLISDHSSAASEDEEEYSIFQLYPHTPTSEYMTRCELEDIEPCLQFGNSNSRMHVKTMMSHLSQMPCFIESITLEEAKALPSLHSANTTVYYRPIWERLTSSTTHLKHQLECSACGKRRRTTTMASYYRFRLNENEDWLLIDQNCRDRLVAVCNFYSFLRHIQMGYYNLQLLNDLYLENVDLRLKMFYARMGNI